MSASLTAPPPGGGIPAIGNGVAVDPIALARQMMPRPVTSPEDESRQEQPEEKPSVALERQLRTWAKMMNVADDKEIADLIETIAARVKTDYDLDENSRNEWREKYRKWMDFALQIAEQKTFPWPEASNVIYPLITVAAIQFAARAYPAIIRDSNVVKGRVIGKDDGKPNPAYLAFIQQRQQEAAQQPPTPMGPGMPPAGAVMPGMGPANAGQPPAPPPMWLEEPGAKLKRANAIGRHMSWQLLSEQEEWEPQTDALLIALPIVGTYFRKTYYSPALRRNVSETVDAMALCVNYYAKSFETAPRQTELIRMYPHEIETAIRSGLFTDYGDGAKSYGHDMGANTNDQEQGKDPNAQQDEDAATTFLEQHCRYDLDEDGYAEPWIITIARDSGKLARISAGYEMAGVKWTDNGRVREIEKIAVYTKYGFIPSPASKVYDLGFGHLLYPINEAINTTLNQMFDAGSLQNVGGGFIGSGLSVNTGAVRFAMGEYKPVNVMGGTIRDNVFPIPFPGPSAVLMELLKFLVDAGERVAAVKDIMTGDMPGDNTSGITTLAVIEQGLKVFSAIYKRIYRSLTYEFKKLYRLNRIYGAEEMEYEGGTGAWSMISRSDYEAGAGVEPVSDPQMVTDMQRLGRAQFMLTFKDDPRVKGAKIIQDAFTAAMIPDAESYMNEAPPQPDPKVVLKNRELDIREKREMIDLMLRQQKDKALIVKDITQAELFLAQVRKLDNDVQLGWVEQHLQMLRDQMDAVSALSGADHSDSSGDGSPGSGGTDSGAMGALAAPPGIGAPPGTVPPGLQAGA